MMNEIIDLLQKIVRNTSNNVEWLRTIIATIIGIVVGSMITDIFQRIGKIHIECIRADQKYYSGKMNASNKENEVGIYFDPQKAICFIDLLIYNTAKSRKIIKKIIVDIYYHGKIVDGSYLFENSIKSDNKINVINVDSGSISEKRLFFQIEKNVLEKIDKECNKKNRIKLYLRYEIPRILLRRKRYKLFDIY